MAIDTNNKKISIMEWCSVWEPGIPMVPTTPFSQGDKQHFLWGYSGISWTSTVLGQDLFKGMFKGLFKGMR